MGWGDKLWNGKNAALSLTFDDGLPCQIEYALPAMKARGIPGTFFLIENSEYDTEFRKSVWLDAIEQGHEIGSHSVNHRKAATLTEDAANFEALQSKLFLQAQLAHPITSFCYPYTDAPGHLQTAVRKAGYLQARGGRIARENKFVRPNDGINLLNVPCYHVGPSVVHNNDYSEWIDEALNRGAWVTLMFHGVGPDKSQWDNVTLEQFEGLLDTLVLAKKAGLWVGTFGDVAENLRRHRG